MEKIIYIYIHTYIHTQIHTCTQKLALQNSATRFKLHMQLYTTYIPMQTRIMHISHTTHVCSTYLQDHVRSGHTHKSLRPAYMYGCMYVRMYVYLCMYVCTSCVCMHVYLIMFVCMWMHAYLIMCVHMYACRAQQYMYTYS